MNNPVAISGLKLKKKEKIQTYSIAACSIW